MDERQHPNRETRPMVTEVSADQAESFGILRRPQVQGDRLPEGLFDGDLIGQLGLNPALARRAPTELGDVWVVPGNGYIGLHDRDSSCNRTKDVAARGMMMWTSQQPDHQNLVHGLVPDGVEEVTLLAENGTMTTVVVTENVYGAVLDGPFSSHRFVGPSGTVEHGLR